MRYDDYNDVVRTCNEIDTMANLNSEYVCKIFGGCVVNEDEIWIVMELIDGGDLYNFLTSSPPLSYFQQISFCIQIAQAVNYLHSQSSPILHRDIKSFNFLVKNKTQLILTDFGTTKTKDKIGNSIAGQLHGMLQKLYNLFHNGVKNLIFSVLG